MYDNTETGMSCDVCGDDDHDTATCEVEHCDGCGEVVDNCADTTEVCGVESSTARDFGGADLAAWIRRGCRASGFDALEDEGDAA